MSHSDSHGHDHHEEKQEGFLNTVFDETVGGFAILWVVIALAVVSLLMLLG